MLYSVSWELPICKFPLRSLSIHVGVCSAVIGYFNFGKTLHFWSHNNFQHKSITVIQEANKPFEQCYSSLFSAQSDEPSEYSAVGFLSSCSLCQLIIQLQTYLNHIKRQRHCEIRMKSFMALIVQLETSTLYAAIVMKLQGIQQRQVSLISPWCGIFIVF